MLATYTQMILNEYLMWYNSNVASYTMVEIIARLRKLTSRNLNNLISKSIIK